MHTLAVFDFASRRISSSAGSCQYPIVSRGIPCTNKSKKEVSLNGRTFDSGECDSLQETYRRIAMCLGVFRVLREKERENEIIFITVVVVGLIDRVARSIDCE